MYRNPMDILEQTRHNNELAQLRLQVKLLRNVLFETLRR